MSLVTKKQDKITIAREKEYLGEPECIFAENGAFQRRFRVYGAPRYSNKVRDFFVFEKPDSIIVEVKFPHFVEKIILKFGKTNQLYFKRKSFTKKWNHTQFCNYSNRPTSINKFIENALLCSVKYDEHCDILSAYLCELILDKAAENNCDINTFGLDKLDNKIKLVNIVCRILYPCFNSFDIEVYNSIYIDPKLSRKLRNSKNLNHFLQRTTKFKGKQFKEQIRSDFNGFYEWHILLKDVFTENQAVNLLNRKKSILEFIFRNLNAEEGENKKLKLDFIKQIGYNGFINSFDYNSIQLYTDSFEMYKELKQDASIDLKIEGSIETIHDKLIDESLKTSSSSFCKNLIQYNYTKTEKRFAQKINKDWEIVLPENSAYLKSWGKKLRNCLGSYVNRVADKDSAILGVFFQGKLTYAIEVYKKRDDFYVNQFYGFANSNPKKDHKELILEALYQSGLSKPKRIKTFQDEYTPRYEAIF